jgi:hypothetical protein
LGKKKKKTLKKNPKELNSNPQLETPARLLKCQNLEEKRKRKRKRKKVIWKRIKG